MVAYSAPTDLLLGEIPLPSYIDPAKVLQDAADEIDSKLGHIFETPFNITGSGTGVLARPAALLIKRISNSLATGRLILAIASPEENSNLHAYGWSLVKEANEALYAIAEGTIQLEGAVPNPGAPTQTGTTPLINNLDPESHVEAFYDRIANPSYPYPGVAAYPRTRWQGG